MGVETKQCFVVMPYGRKPFVNVIEAKDPATPVPARTSATIEQAEIDFNAIYDKIIKPAVEDEKRWHLRCVRSDEVRASGMIHREMIRQIIDADVVIVDISLGNSNVFYELGVRHALRRSTTVVIRNARIQQYIPFNVAGMRAIDYDDSTSEAVAASRERLKSAIRDSFSGKDVDSLVHTLFNDILITRNTPPIMEQEMVLREVAAAPGHSIGYITGDLAQVRCVDAWVNPENTKMEMGRLHDDSISATVRFYGAERDKLNHVRRDLIREELELLLDDQANVGVEPGTVLVTSAGRLQQSHRVKALFHVAALHGEPGKGYLPIRDYPGCVRRVLEMADRLNSGSSLPVLERLLRRRFIGHRREVFRPPLDLKGQIKSIVIPLFGSRTAGQHPQDVADLLFRAACVHFENNAGSAIEQVYFLAYTGSDKQYCEAAIGSLDKSSRLVAREGAPAGRNGPSGPAVSGGGAAP